MKSKLKPFWFYYGGKYRAAPKYQPPRYGKIIEPFAGAAGYATRYFERDVLLCDSDPIICGLWEYLIHVTESEIRALPLIVETTTDDLNVCQEAKWLIGFWINSASATPRKSPSSWMKCGLRPNSHWGEVIRGRIADQVGSIRHWKIKNIDYEMLDDEKATWFIDPPYSGKAGKHYGHKILDYQRLSEWSQARSGQVIVCEQIDAKWLPFEFLGKIRSNPGPKGKTHCHEVVWYGGTDEIATEAHPLISKDS